MPKSFLNQIAIGVPLAAALSGWIVFSATPEDLGRIALVVFAIVAMGVLSLLGAVTSAAALVRREPLRWLSVAGLLGNVAVVLAVAGSTAL